MTKHPLLRTLALLLVMVWFSKPVCGQDWKPPTDLFLWLDAAHASPRAAKSGQLDQWIDRSGHANHFVQHTDSQRPNLEDTGHGSIVRFDGVDDCMRCLRGDRTLAKATLVMMVAPRSNEGDFRGIIAANATQRRDYESGFTIDLGPVPTRHFDVLNVEGRGFIGARDLLDSSSRFGSLRLIEVTLDSQSKQIKLAIDGKEQASRPWSGEPVSLTELTLGARFYTNGPGEQIVRGHAHCDVAELMIFDCVLDADQRESVRTYLKSKHHGLQEYLSTQALETPRGVELVKVDNPPTVQMLMPGFQVDELPVSLTNVNSLRYRPDGKLVTLGYNGDVHLLTDSDGDGLEDVASLFWKNEGSVRGPIGMVMTRPEDDRGWGLIFPSKGKVSLLLDRDRDDRADEELVIASGWKEITQSVDAVGIAMDRDGCVFFGLGTADYSNAYLVDGEGHSKYDIASERGTVQKLSSDFKIRETVCTGVRFPIAFAFNSLGDLFCTEQEGATWLANGNPADELLHIQPKRHYGFPPRHPRYNPGVIDEPSTFDFGPQHQSTCGMVFNESVNGGPIFGPVAWQDNAILCGESRGKLWRTELVKSVHGYVASSQLIACLQMLTVDACVSPRGDLIVACHSGPPDWGTGPAGIGKLFRIRPIRDEVPRPLVTWAESPSEIRIAFDHPLDPSQLQNLAQRIRIQRGAFAKAGDRFENLVPPYAVVQRQAMTDRYTHGVTGVSVTNDRRTLLIHVAPMQHRTSYTVTLPSMDVNEQNHSQKSESPLSQIPEMDVDFELHGVQAEWVAEKSDKPSEQASDWSGWLPHVDLQVAKQFTRGSSQHERLWESVQKAGRLTLRSKLNVHDILRPKVQPGSTLDYSWPDEQVTIVVRGSVPFVLKSQGELVTSQVGAGGQHEVQKTLEPNRSELLDFELEIESKSERRPQLSMAVYTNEDARLRPIPLHRFVLPWVPNSPTELSNESQPAKIAEIEGGNWGRGRRIFHSEAAGCFKCHAIHLGGAKIGPDLTNLIYRDYKSVLRDIIHPSFAINPDYIGHRLEMESGQVFTGVLRTENGQLSLGDAQGKVTRIQRDEIVSMKPSEISVMPTGLHEKLSAEQMRDLMTFLLLPPPHMPLDSALKAPPIRSKAEVANALSGSSPLPESLKALKVVLVGGDKDHGPGEHDYPAWQMAWGQLMAAAPEIDVSMAWGFPNEEQQSAADLLIFFQKGTWNDERAAAMDRFFARGGGAVYIHWAVNGDERVGDFSKRIGLASYGGNIRYRHGALRLDLHSTDHPIMRNLETLDLYDESYWKLTGDLNQVTLFATSLEDREATPQVWGYEKDQGRVFVSIPGHYSWTFDDPLFRILLLRGMAWAAKEPIDRFNELVPLGARMER